MNNETEKKIKRIKSNDKKFYKYKTYIFNHHGVCINGRNVWKKNYKSIELSIEVAETPKGWIYGIHIQSKSFGHGSPCSIYGNYYKSKKTAFIKGLKENINNLNPRGSCISKLEMMAIKKFKKQLIEIYKKLIQPKEKTLFDNI